MAKTLKLTSSETISLKLNGRLETSRNGLDILVEYNDIYEKYDIYVINPYDTVKSFNTQYSIKADTNAHNDNINTINRLYEQNEISKDEYWRLIHDEEKRFIRHQKLW